MLAGAQLNDVDSTLLTVLVLLALIAAVSWMVIGTAMRMAPKAALRFASANVALAGAAVLVTHRSAIPSYWNYQVGDCLAFAATALLYNGILAVSKQRPPAFVLQWGPLIAAVLLSACVAPDHSSFLARVLVASGVQAWYFVCGFSASFRGLKNEAFPVLARLAASWPFLVAGLVFLARGASVVVLAQSGVHFTVEDEMRVGQFLWFMLVLILIANISLGGLVAGRLVIRIRDLANRDYLTGCQNRRALDARMAIEMLRNHRSGEHLACVMFDIDHFKAVNDTYGHEAGDATLKHAVKVAQGVVRAVDALGRFGGEEFVVLMPSTHLTGAREGAERIRLALEANPLHRGEWTITIRASFGVAVLGSTETKESLLRRADAAMYEAKRLGRNRVEVASDPVPANPLFQPVATPPQA